MDTAEEIAEVDAFLIEKKWLRGEAHPIWTKTGFASEYGAVWPIQDEADIVRAGLKFRISPRRPMFPTINLIFRRRLIWRVDLVPEDEQKANPPWAYNFGLPPVIRGSHGHEWHDNKDHIQESGSWFLPARRPMPPNIRTLEQLLPWFADSINLELTHGQRGFEVPAQAELY